MEVIQESNHHHHRRSKMCSSAEKIKRKVAGGVACLAYKAEKLRLGALRSLIYGRTPDKLRWGANIMGASTAEQSCDIQ